MQLNIKSETGRLREVILGLPYSNGPVPTLDETFDSKSYESVKNGVYPTEASIIREMEAFEAVLKKYGVKVHRPSLVTNCNQAEIDAYESVYRNIHYKNIYNLPEAVHVEGGDVILYNDTILLGQYNFDDYSSLKTARTNRLAQDYLQMIFPGKKIIPLNLRKSDTDPYEGILHLDCTFMPVGRGKAIIYRDGFINPRDAERLVRMFGKQNVFELTKEEMYWMNSNIFSISEDVVVVEENFTRLSDWLRKQGITVEPVPYREISKMGGLLRCSTLPLIRD